MDEMTRALLARYLDEADDTLKPGELWTIYRRFLEEHLGRARDEPPGENAVAPLEALTVLRLLISDLQNARGWLAIDAHRDGASWAQIGTALDMSKQAAWELGRAHTEALPPTFADLARHDTAALGPRPDTNRTIG